MALCQYCILNSKGQELLTCTNKANYNVSFDNGDTHTLLCDECFTIVKKKVPLNTLTFYSITGGLEKWKMSLSHHKELLKTVESR